MSRRLRRLGSDLIPAFVRQRRGNVAVNFAMLLVPMLGAIGLAVDFGQALTARNKAQVAADAAALQASGIARDLIQKGDGSRGNTDAALAEAKKRAEALFSAYAKQTGLSNYTFAAKVTRTGQTIEASGDYSVQTSNFIAPIFGKDAYDSVGNAKSSASLPSYVDVYLAMDVSQSMGLGATQDDMGELYKRTGCVFGCHVATEGQSSSNSAVAKANNIDLRIDVLRRAVQKMIATAKDDAGDSAVYRFAMYAMGADPESVREHKTSELSALSPNFGDLISKAGAIDLGYNDASGVGDSHINEQIDDVRKKIPESGDGSSQAKAKKFLFVVTDGVRDTWGHCTYGHCMGTVDPDVCRKVKDKDIIVGVLYTTYLPVYNNPANTASGYRPEYRDLVYNNGLHLNIRPTLEECASPGWFFEASDTPGIDEAMRKMFEQITLTPMLTN